MAYNMYYYVILYFVYATIATSSAAPIQFDTSVLSNCTGAHFCTYSWSNSSIWIGGRVPSSDDNIIIDIGKNYVILTCDNNCAAKNVTTSGKSLTFQSSVATSATFDQITCIGGGINFEGGSLRVKNFVVQNDQSISFSIFNNVDMIVDNMRLTSVDLVSSTAKIGSLTIDGSLMLFYTQLTLQNHANIFDIMSIEGSTLTFQGGCSVLDATPSNVVNSTINITPDCPFTPNSMTSFYGSKWNIESAARSSYTLTSLFFLANSTIKLTGVTLSVKSQIELRNSSVIQTDSPIEISYDGTIGGYGSVIGDLVVKNFGRIQAHYSIDEQNSQHHQKLTILGTLSLDQSASIYLKQFESIHANSILCGYSTFQFFIPVIDWQIDTMNYTVITTNQDGLVGSFGFMNASVFTGYFQFMNTKSDLTVFWYRYDPAPQAPYSVNHPIVPPHSVNQPIFAPVAITPEVIPPQTEQDPGTNTTTVIIVIESIMIGLGLILGGALLYRRFIKRRNYTQVPNFDQL